jgi:polysaccharide chain length determinant protein (PEP-CTERM system associated)
MGPMSASSQPWTITTLADALRRRLGRALAVFVVVAVSGCAAVLSLPDVFRATATVLLETDPVSSAISRPTFQDDLDARLKSASERVLSRDRLTPIVERFGLYPELRGRVPEDQLVERLRHDLTLSARGGDTGEERGSTLVLESSYRARRADLAASVANAVAALFVDLDERSRSRQANEASAVLEARLTALKENLDQSESEVSRYKSEHLGELPEQMAANLAALERLHAELQRVRERKQTLIERVATGAGAAGGEAAETPAARLARLRQELARLRTRYEDAHPEVITVRNEIAGLEQQIAQGDAPRAFDPEAEIRSLDGDAAKLDREIAAYQTRVDGSPRCQERLAELERASASAKEMYESMLHRVEDAQVSRAAETRRDADTPRILDAALVPTRPYAPDRFRLFVLTLGAAIGAALGAIALSERLDTSFHSVEELRAFAGIPVIGSLPLVVTRRARRIRRWRAVLAVAVAAGMVAVTASGAARVARGHADWAVVLSRGAK